MSEAPKSTPAAPGRKSLEGAGQSPVLQVRMTQAQKDKAMRLGGAAWVRRMIDKAKETAQ